MLNPDGTPPRGLAIEIAAAMPLLYPWEAMMNAVVSDTAGLSPKKRVKILEVGYSTHLSSAAFKAAKCNYSAAHFLANNPERHRERFDFVFSGPTGPWRIQRGDVNHDNKLLHRKTMVTYMSDRPALVRKLAEYAAICTHLVIIKETPAAPEVEIVGTDQQLLTECAGSNGARHRIQWEHQMRKKVPTTEVLSRATTYLSHYCLKQVLADAGLRCYGETDWFYLVGLKEPAWKAKRTV